MAKPIYLFSISSHSDTVNINSLDITVLKPTINFLEYDYLIATSKQVSVALQQYSAEYKKRKILAISNATAESLKKIGCNILEVGSGYGDNLSSLIDKYPKNTKWLYLRAKKVASNFVQEQVKKGFLIDEVIVYESKCSKAIEKLPLAIDATLIFTSPSSVKCFMQTNTLLKTHNIIVIGESTKKALPFSIHCNVSKSMSIDACVELAKKL